MKLLLLFLLIPFLSIGQIVITNSDLPSSGQNYYYSTILNTLSFDVNLTVALGKTISNESLIKAGGKEVHPGIQPQEKIYYLV